MLPTLPMIEIVAMSAPSMTLFHNPASPFVRKVMVLLHETGQMNRVALQASQLTPVSPDQALNKDNPLGKIPALRLADGNVLYDSRVILDYLDYQHVGNPLIPRDGSARWRRLTLASLADGIMDAAVMVRYEVALRTPEKALGRMARQSARQDSSRAGIAGGRRDCRVDQPFRCGVDQCGLCLGLPGSAPSGSGMAQRESEAGGLVF
ncbi:glutathione S-transferase [Pseudomonas sp. BS3782 TE3695]